MYILSFNTQIYKTSSRCQVFIFFYRNLVQYFFKDNRHTFIVLFGSFEGLLRYNVSSSQEESKLSYCLHKLDKAFLCKLTWKFAFKLNVFKLIFETEFFSQINFLNLQSGTLTELNIILFQLKIKQAAIPHNYLQSIDSSFT